MLELGQGGPETDHEFQLHRNRYHTGKSESFILWRADLTFKDHLHGIGMVVGILAYRWKSIKLYYKKNNELQRKSLDLKKNLNASFYASKELVKYQLFLKLKFNLNVGVQ